MAAENYDAKKGMKDLIKRIMRFYWAHSQAYSLITLPINGVGALSSVLVLFTVVSGVKFPAWAYLLLFLGATILLFLIGIAAKQAGLLAYWQSLNNSQNPELLAIKKAVEKKKK